MHHSVVRVNVVDLVFVVSGVWPGMAHGPGATRPDLALNMTGCGRCHNEASDPVVLNAGLLYLVRLPGGARCRRPAGSRGPPRWCW
jgi:hypothetical protein